MKKILFLSLIFVFVVSAIGLMADFVQININEATAAELAKLPGMSRPNANRIVEHIEENGPFESLDDLKEITHVTRSGNEVPSFTLASGLWRAPIRPLFENDILTVEGGTDTVDLVAVFKVLYPNPVDLNTAEISEIASLQGISRPNATRIAQHRKANDGLKSIDCLKDITHATASNPENPTFVTARGAWRAPIRPLIEAGRIVVEEDYDPSIDEDLDLDE